MNTQDDPKAKANLLIVEVGNSHFTIATQINEQVCTNERFRHDQVDDAIEHAKQAWKAMPDDIIKAIAAGSVVSSVLEELDARLGEQFDTPVMTVGDQLHRPMSLAVEKPESVGIDRVCCAAAAYDRIQQACVVTSFGTAITIDCVNAEGVFMGGAILPGLDLQAMALHEGTAALPKITIEPTQTVFGADTENAIRNGIIYGTVGSLREIVERYATELNVWPQLVVTGGNAELISQHCEFIDNLVPDLCVMGIGLAYRKHFSPFDDACES